MMKDLAETAIQALCSYFFQGRKQLKVTQTHESSPVVCKLPEDLLTITALLQGEVS